jgi:heterodisulfide reductase subunit B
MSDYIFYPGCSMESSAKSYYESTIAVCKSLGIGLKEIDDWNCCGATEYLSLDILPAYALIARNLALAEQQSNGNKTIIAPCSACYLNLAKADHYMHDDKKFGAKVNDALAAGGLHYTPGKLDVRHLLDVVVKPLSGLRIVPYLGCMLPRPDYGRHYSDTEHPDELDHLFTALGAEVVDFPLKTHCCGGHMTQIGPDTAFEMIRRIIFAADQLKADVIVTVCPMCQMNLDAFQGQMNSHFKTDFKMPVLFFTQLMGIAFGETPEAVGFGSELVSAQSAMGRIGVETPTPAELAPEKKRKSTGLPMPKARAKTGHGKSERRRVHEH